MHNSDIEVPESSTAYLKVTLRDSDGNLAGPTTIQYEIRCLTNSKTVRALTSVLLPTSRQVIKLDVADNTLIDQRNSRERRSVTVIANNGLGDQILDEFRYAVLNSRSHPA